LLSVRTTPSLSESGRLCRGHVSPPAENGYSTPSPATDRRFNDGREFQAAITKVAITKVAITKVAITLRVMIADKN
ncbi:MAG TPA: hypothetical protein PLF81_27470, partial [Candidatus Anammoximicrobium sp.]|nr:hypothetical protein [Candidatus Anammoximicrobium sp.]